MKPENHNNKMPEFIHLSEEVFRHLETILPLIKKTIPMDATLAVTDTENYVRTLPFGDGIDEGLNGKPLHQGDGIAEAMENRRTEIRIIDSTVFGYAFKSCCTPIFNEEGRVIGSLAIGISLENQQKLQKMAEQLSEMYDKILSAAEELSNSAAELSSIIVTLANVQDEMKEQFRGTDKILSMIHSVSETTKLLGLNAAIEAARAGEHGRGFSVVAQEIRKLADDSSSSVKKIREMLEEVKGKSERLNDTVQQVTRISGQQAASSQEVSASLQELKAVVHNIEHVARVV